jgi:hypothetical protein
MIGRGYARGGLAPFFSCASAHSFANLRKT